MPEDFEQLERVAVGVMLAAPSVLRRVRQVVDGPILLHKGPEAARVYPDAAMRGYDDLDLIVRDALAAQRALVNAGFVEIGDPDAYRDIQHLRPLELPGLALRLEIHRHPKWPDSLRPPRPEELFEASVPSSVDVEGIDAPAPVHHALILAAHAWAHVPLRRLRDVLDVGAAGALLDAEDAAAVSRRWGIERVWRTTIAAAESIFGDSPRSIPLRTWAHHLVETRERTVFETHLQGLLSPFWELPPGGAVRAAGARLADEFRPAAGEEWQTKLFRTRIALRNARRPRLDHDRALGALAQRPSRRSRRAPNDRQSQSGEDS